MGERSSTCIAKDVHKYLKDYSYFSLHFNCPLSLFFLPFLPLLNFLSRGDWAQPSFLSFGLFYFGDSGLPSMFPLLHLHFLFVSLNYSFQPSAPCLFFFFLSSSPASVSSRSAFIAISILAKPSPNTPAGLEVSPLTRSIARAPGIGLLGVPGCVGTRSRGRLLEHPSEVLRGYSCWSQCPTSRGDHCRRTVAEDLISQRQKSSEMESSRSP